MKELNVYLKQKNHWLAIFGDKPLSLKSAKDRQAIAANIDSDLSSGGPRWEGELAGNLVRSRYTALTMAAKQLKKLDPSVTFYG